MNWMQMVEVVSAVILCVVFATVAAAIIVARGTAGNGEGSHAGSTRHVLDEGSHSGAAGIEPNSHRVIDLDRQEGACLVALPWGGIGLPWVVTQARLESIRLG